MRCKLFLPLILLGWQCFSQALPSSQAEWRRALENHEANHEDYLYLSTNGNYFVSGELLQFSAFCISRHSQALAPLSRVGYIALINEEKEPVLQTKVLLTEGRGYGDLFLTSSLPSGMYTLVGYTGLQKSGNRSDLFQKAITLINPFGNGVREQVATGGEAKVRASRNPPVAGVINSFIFEDPSDTYLGATVRIINEAGDVLGSFVIEQRVQCFDYTPSGNDRMVLTTPKGNNAFLEIPKAASQGIVTRVEEESNAYVATIRSPRPIEVDIVVRSNSQFITHRPITLSKASTLRLSHEELPDAPITLEVWQTGILLDRVDFAHGQSNASLAIETDQNRYGRRAKVTLSLSSASESDVSLVVRNREHLSKNEKDIHQLLLQSAESNSIDYQRHNPAEKPYPQTDLHGDIISGIVVDASDQPIAGAPVFVTDANTNFHLLTALTNEEGRFVVAAPPSIQSNLLLAQTSAVNAELRFDDEWFRTYSDTAPPELTVHKGDINLIEKKSLYSQIENAYYLSKSQTELPLINRIFYGTPSRSYVLADFTRFSTLEETIREIVPGVVVSKKGDDFDLAILDPQSRLSRENTLVLLDGLPIQNINDLMEMDALDIEKIEFVREEYFYGPLDFSGVISLQTKEGKLRGFSISEEVVRHDYVPLQPPKQYHRPTYEGESNDRIPDYRTVLYWEPIIKANGNEVVEYSFYTSDVPGTYEAIVDGFDAEGNALRAQVEFIVD